MNLDRYRIVNGKYIFHTFQEGQAFNSKVWLEDDGRFQDKTETRVGEDGIEYQVVIGKYTYYNEDGTPDLVKEQELEDANIKQELKSYIQKALDTARVEVETTNIATNNVGVIHGYDANETSQNRMDRAAKTLIGDEIIYWRMYNNEEAVITKTELNKALRASGILMSTLWFCKSKEDVDAIISQDSEWLERFSK